MHVSAKPPLAVAKLVWQPRPDAFVMTVVCKATYALRNGPCELLGTPDAPQMMDLYWQDGSPRSVRLPNDLAPFKRHVDVMVVGHAWAPHGQAVPSLVARLAVGGVNKAIGVYGDRYWLPEGRLSDAVPFVRMPLRWMRAAGGPRSWNPVGIAPSVDPQAPAPPPNFEPVGFVLRSPTQEIPPVGLGPIAGRWPTRAEHLRAHRNAWSHEAWHEQPLPAGVDASYWNAAPKDQQITELPAQAQILLEHLHPELPRMIAVVEDVRPRAMVTRGGGSPQEVWLRADTLLIDTDRGVCCVTWRAAVPLRHAKEEGVVVVAPTRGITAPSVAPSVPTNVPSSAPNAPTMPEKPRGPRTITMMADAAPKPAAALPFTPSSAPAMPPPEPRRERPPVSFARDDDEPTLTGNVGKPEGFATLPFQRSPLRRNPESSAAPAPAVAKTLPPIDPDDDGTETRIPEARAAAAAPLPFVAVGKIEPDDDGTQTLVPAARPAAAPALPFRPVAPAPAADEPEPETERKPKIQADSALPFAKPGPAASPLFVLSAPGAVVTSPETVVTPASAVVIPPSAVVTPPSAVVTPPPPPAFSGTPIFSAPLGTSAVLPFTAAPAPSPVQPASPAPPREEPAPLPEKRAELSIERYARIKVDLWGARAALHEVLSRYGIDEVAWRVHERQQAEALAGEAREGRCDLALALCAAFEAAKAPGVAPPPLGGIA